MSEYIYSGPDKKVPQGQPMRLPKRVLGVDGFHYGGLSGRTAKNLKALGFSPAPAKPSYDATTQRVVWVGEGWEVRDIPPPEVKEPEPRPITQIEFIALAQQAGGMTDEQLVASKKDANLAAMWIKFDMAASLSLAAPDVQAGIAGLDALGYLPKGKDAVLAAWPNP